MGVPPLRRSDTPHCGRWVGVAPIGARVIVSLWQIGGRGRGLSLYPWVVRHVRLMEWAIWPEVGRKIGGEELDRC
jgi:hypothetical protein